MVISSTIRDHEDLFPNMEALKGRSNLGNSNVNALSKDKEFGNIGRIISDVIQNDVDMVADCVEDFVGQGELGVGQENILSRARWKRKGRVKKNECFEVKVMGPKRKIV